MVQYSGAILIACLPCAASAFLAPRVGTARPSGCGRAPSPRASLAASSGPTSPEQTPPSEGDDGSDGAAGASQKKPAAARAGGRRPRRHAARETRTRTAPASGGPFAAARRWALPLCLLLAALKFLLGGLGGGDGGAVYYSSTVYQSTTYSRDGRVETTRKEDFRSNVPGLAERARESSRERDGGDARYFDETDEELRDVEEAIGSALFREW